jgi:hypothetical protein
MALHRGDHGLREVHAGGPERTGRAAVGRELERPPGVGHGLEVGAAAEGAAVAVQAVQESTVAPSANPDVGLRVERDGKQRWLVSRDAPEVLWPRILEFWQQNGFGLAVENPEAGVMETDWAENRAKIPQDFIRNSIGKVFDSLYSTSERDKFRTRLERTPEGGTEVYISHRGAQEKLTGQVMNQSTVWTSRPSDPDLEAEFLGRLMASLGKDPKAAKAAVKEAPQEAQRARVAQEGDMRVVEVDEGHGLVLRAGRGTAVDPVREEAVRDGGHVPGGREELRELRENHTAALLERSKLDARISSPNAEVSHRDRERQPAADQPTEQT